jgi:hypothetical protein
MPDLTLDEAHALATEAVVFGYPLVLMDVSRAVLENSSRPGTGRGRANVFTHARAFPDASSTAVVTPNADTLYSTAWLDLTAGPVLLRVPPSPGRYYLLPMLSAWTDVFASPGTRTTGAKQGTYAVVGPGWRGGLPPGVREIRAPTAMVRVIGRTQANGTADYPDAHRFQNGLTLTPLSAGARGYAPPVDPTVDVTTPPPDQVEAMDADTFFGRLARLLVDNPPAPADTPALQRFAALGLRPGRFAPGPGLAGALDGTVKAAIGEIKATRRYQGERVNGWWISRHLGRYGTNYRQRASVALFGLGANLPADAMYPSTDVDGDGQRLAGAHRYVLRFPPRRTPPARAFWSLTMYNDRYHFVDNPLGRYAIGDRHPLAVSVDGSLDLWLQHGTPGPDRESNWLPAPAGAFNLILRIYWPAQEVLDGSWTPPRIERLA